MTNQERFAKTVNWEPVDRILTYDFIDNMALLKKYGDYYESRQYSFEEMVESNIKSFKKIGLVVTRYTYDPVNHWMGLKIANWIR